MNFYPFHIGDYASATRHLTWMEDAAYRRLLDVYYVKEGPLPTEKRQVYRLAVASTEEQREAIDTVLEEFFELTDSGYTHMRCEDEIAHAVDKRNKAAQSANTRWSNAKNKGDALPAQGERNANASNEACERIHEACEGNAPNPNPNPNPKVNTRAPSRKRDPSPSPARPDDVEPQTWGDWLVLRRAKKAPVSETVISGARAEAAKAGMPLDAFLRVWCTRGSQGLQADWLSQHERTANGGTPKVRGLVL